MKRTKKLPPIPDAINCEMGLGYVQVPNDFLRHPQISAKAKVVLGILLGNKKGWKSFITTIEQYMKESEETVRNAAKELEKFGYLVRLNYRDKKTKQWKGWLWAYTNTPFNFEIHDSLLLLDLHGFEIPNVEERLRRKISPEGKNPKVGFPKLGKLRTNNTNYNNINQNNYSSTASTDDEDLSKKSSNGYITPKDFFEFWPQYPKDRQGSKGEAITAWDKLCRNKIHRPTKNRILRALEKQKKSERWTKGERKYIPLASTWLNKKRWLDDPAQMKVYKFDNDEVVPKEEEIDDREWKRQFGYDKE